MALEITGTIIEISQEKQTPNGKVKNFAIQQPGDYGKIVCFGLWNDKTSLVDATMIDTEVTVKFNAASRKSGEYWNTNLTAYEVK